MHASLSIHQLSIEFALLTEVPSERVIQRRWVLSAGNTLTCNPNCCDPIQQPPLSIPPP